MSHHHPAAQQPSLPLPFPTTTTGNSNSNSSTMAPSSAPSNVDLTYFLALPWCEALLSAPGTSLLPTPSRIPKASTEDSMFAVTLRTGDTIPYMLSFSSMRPAPVVGGGTGGNSSAAAAVDGSAAPAPAETIEQVSTLFAIGEGINGYPATAHGGVIAALFDEAMGVSMMRLRASASNPKCPAGGTDIVTASLKVDFVRRLGTPGEVVVRVWVAERRGRKWVLDAEMADAGGVVGRASAVWVEVRASL